MAESSPPLKNAINPQEWLPQHGDYLFRFALSRLRDPNTAEEVVEETFVAALRAIDQYSGKGVERAWLLGILKRKIIDFVRRRSHASALPLRESDEGDLLFNATGHWKGNPRFLGGQPSAALEKEEFWEAFRGCLAKLPQRQADVFVLRELDDEESGKICKDMEISTSNLWVLLHRARLRLAKCLRERWKDDFSR